MSIEQPNVVDFIGVEPESQKVVLTISDHLDWADEQEHLSKLQEKINAYLRFIESGEMAQTYPMAVGRSPVIEIVMRISPPQTAVVAIEEARVVCESAGN